MMQIQLLQLTARDKSYASISFKVKLICSGLFFLQDVKSLLAVVFSNSIAYGLKKLRVAYATIWEYYS